MTKILPMKYPVVTSYAKHANLLSLISTDDRYLPWFYSNYIQLEGRRGFRKGEAQYIRGEGFFMDFYTPSLIEKCPWVNLQTLFRDSIKKWNKNIIHFIEDCIDLGNCLYTVVDTFYIPGYWNYNKKHSTHNLFIYGYNRDSEVFYIADNFPKFEYRIATYDQVRNAYNEADLSEDWINGVQLLQYNHKGKYELDLIHIINSLEDYLNSNNTSTLFRMYEEPKDWPFGVETHELLVSYLKTLINGDAHFDIRCMHLLWEHKLCMLNRIQYLIDNSFLKNKPIYTEYLEIEKKALLARNLFLKYSFTSEKDSIIKIIGYIDEIVEKERSILNVIIHDLRSYVEVERNVQT